MHLLLTTDSVNQVNEISILLQKCRNIVSALHFKSVMIEELSRTEDQAIIENMKKAISDTSELLEFDDQYCLEEDATETDTHHHVTVKSSCRILLAKNPPQICFAAEFFSLLSLFSIMRCLFFVFSHSPLFCSTEIVAVFVVYARLRWVFLCSLIIFTFQSYNG